MQSGNAESDLHAAPLRFNNAEVRSADREVPLAPAGAGAFGMPSEGRDREKDGTVLNSSGLFSADEGPSSAVLH
jgi:hypothetical protein